MKKRELVKWLEKKEYELLSEAKTKFHASVQNYRDKLCKDSNLPDTAKQIYEHFAAAEKLWGKWKSENITKDSDDSFNAVLYGYSTLDSIFNHYGFDSEKTCEAIRTQNITYPKKKEAEQNAVYAALRQNISKNYTNVIAAVKASASAKEATAYLANLGFDLSEIDKPVPTNMTLTTPIDTAFLFLKKEVA